MYEYPAHTCNSAVQVWAADPQEQAIKDLTLAGIHIIKFLAMTDYTNSQLKDYSVAPRSCRFYYTSLLAHVDFTTRRSSLM